MRGFSALWIVGVCGLMVNCAHRAPQAEPVQVHEVKLDKPQRLELKANPERVEVTQFHSASWVRTFENSQILREHEEDLDFATQSSTSVADEKQGLLKEKVKTIHKDGDGDLHAMAYPELGETLEITVNKQGGVFHVPGFMPNSLFYVPSISLPADEVSVGDTWPMTAQWMSHENGIPLRLKMISILKRFVACGPQTCAELELSGTVNMAVESNQKVDFKGELKGIVYFGLQSATVIWGQVNNSESLTMEGQRVSSESCLESILVSPENEKYLFASPQGPCTVEQLKKSP